MVRRDGACEFGSISDAELELGGFGGTDGGLFV